MLALANMTNWNKLSKAWVGDFLPSPSSSPSKVDPAVESIQKALQRTLPLLAEDPTAVPFVCRYRSDVIKPLSTKQVHQLSEYVQKYESLSALREKVITQLMQHDGIRSTIDRAETSISKSELEDIYAPFKPPSKGSLEDRILKEYPNLVAKVDEFWSTKDSPDAHQLLNKLKPQDKAVVLLANRISADVDLMDALMEYCTRCCRIQLKASSGDDGKKKKKVTQKQSTSSSFEIYHDFNNRISNLRDHQVLAIRRGIDMKQLKCTYEVNDAPVDSIIQRAVFPKRMKHHLCHAATKDAWTRLLRKRCTTRLWKSVCKKAEEVRFAVLVSL